MICQTSSHMNIVPLYLVSGANVHAGVVKNSLGRALKEACHWEQGKGFLPEDPLQPACLYYEQMMNHSNSSLQAPADVYQIVCRIYLGTGCSPWLKLQANIRGNTLFPVICYCPSIPRSWPVKNCLMLSIPFTFEGVKSSFLFASIFKPISISEKSFRCFILYLNIISSL